MEELWLVFAIAVGIITIAIAIALLTRRKKQTIQDNTLLTRARDDSSSKVVRPFC